MTTKTKRPPLWWTNGIATAGRRQKKHLMCGNKVLGWAFATTTRRNSRYAFIAYDGRSTNYDRVKAKTLREAQDGLLAYIRGEIKAGRLSL